MLRHVILKVKQDLQKQSFADVFENRCSYKFSNIHKKTPVLESLFNKVVDLQPCHFIKKRLLDRCFPVSITNFLRAFFFPEHLWHSAEKCISPSFFFHPPILDITPFFWNMQTPSPPLDIHHKKISDSVMMHWNKGD